MNHRVSVAILVVFSLLLYTFLLFVNAPPVQLVKYWDAAELLLKRGLAAERVLDFSPTYLYLNLLLVKVNGTVTVLLWLHIAFVTVSCALLYEILLKNFTPMLAFAGAIAFLMSRSLMIFTGTFEPESLLILLLISTTYFLQRNSIRTAIAAGVCFGLMIWTRPNFVLVLFVIPPWYFSQPQNDEWKRKTLSFILPAVLCIGGLWLRNTNTLGYFSPYVMNPGTVFYEGNNPNSRGMSSIYPPVLNQLSENYANQPDYHHELYRKFARAITNRPLSLPQVNSYWKDHAVNFLLDHPGHALRLLATKCFHTFHSYEWHDLSSSYIAETILKEIHFPSIPFGVFSSLAVYGIFLSVKKWKQFLIYYALLSAQLISMLAIYTSARQRISILFLLVIFGCATVEFLVSSRRRWLALLFIIPMFFLLERKTDLMKEEDHLWQNTLMSSKLGGESYVLRRQGKLVDAADLASRAAALTPWLVDSKRPANLHFKDGYIQSAIALVRPTDRATRFDLGILFLENDEPAKARQIFQELADSGYQLKRDDQQSSNLHYYLARCDLLEKQEQSAIENLQRGISESPGDPWILSNLAALTNDSKYQKQLFRYFDDIDAQFFLGNAFLQTTQPAKAAQCFRSVVKWIPDFRRAYVDLAAALAESGDNDSAEITYRKAIGLAPDPVFHEKQILRLFQTIATNQDTPFAHYSYGIVLRQFGDYEEALREQEIASKFPELHAEAQQEILMLNRVLQTDKR